MRKARHRLVTGLDSFAGRAPPAPCWVVGARAAGLPEVPPSGGGRPSRLGAALAAARRWDASGGLAGATGCGCLVIEGSVDGDLLTPGVHVQHLAGGGDEGDEDRLLGASTDSDAQLGQVGHGGVLDDAVMAFDSRTTALEGVVPVL
jgi:hypothetical protein